MNSPQIFAGEKYSDERGNLFFNNTFDASLVKRIYIIENNETYFIRGWIGHKIEQRWFSAVQGSFTVKLIKVDNWKNPSKSLETKEFELTSDKLDILHMPKGYLSSIQSKEIGSKLLVMVDHYFGELQDDYRFPSEYFEKI